MSEIEETVQDLPHTKEEHVEQPPGTKEEEMVEQLPATKEDEMMQELPASKEEYEMVELPGSKEEDEMVEELPAPEEDKIVQELPASKEEEMVLEMPREDEVVQGSPASREDEVVQGLPGSKENEMVQELPDPKEEEMGEEFPDTKEEEAVQESAVLQEKETVQELPTAKEWETVQELTVVKQEKLVQELSDPTHGDPCLPNDAEQQHDHSSYSGSSMVTQSLPQNLDHPPEIANKDAKIIDFESIATQDSPSLISAENYQVADRTDIEHFLCPGMQPPSLLGSGASESHNAERAVKTDCPVSNTVPAELTSDARVAGSECLDEALKNSCDIKTKVPQVSESENKAVDDGVAIPSVPDVHAIPPLGTSNIKAESGETNEDSENKVTGASNGPQIKADETDILTPVENGKSSSRFSFLLDDDHIHEGYESGTEEEQAEFMKELENFFKERGMDFKPPKFYGEGLNCLKLWRAVMRLGGYDKVTSCKLWRQVGESFRPPKTCTTVSWTFRGFYEKALLDYERHKISGSEVSVPNASHPEPSAEIQGSGSGRARRDAAARAMQGWHSQRLLGNGEVSDPIIKDKNSPSLQKREKQLKNIGLMKRKKPSYVEHAEQATRTKAPKLQLDVSVVDVGTPADWVKINVLRTKDCFEVYALVPGLLREEVRVQSDPAGRLIISGEPEHPDNPWGVTSFRKVVSLPSRIDPHQTSAVVTLHGQLFVRVPFEQEPEL